MVGWCVVGWCVYSEWLDGVYTVSGGMVYIVSGWIVCIQ